MEKLSVTFFFCVSAVYIRCEFARKLVSSPLPAFLLEHQTNRETQHDPLPSSRPWVTQKIGESSSAIKQPGS